MRDPLCPWDAEWHRLRRVGLSAPCETCSALSTARAEAEATGRRKALVEAAGVVDDVWDDCPDEATGTCRRIDERIRALIDNIGVGGERPGAATPGGNASVAGAPAQGVPGSSPAAPTPPERCRCDPRLSLPLLHGVVCRRCGLRPDDQPAQGEEK